MKEVPLDLTSLKKEISMTLVQPIKEEQHEVQDTSGLDTSGLELNEPEQNVAVQDLKIEMTTQQDAKRGPSQISLSSLPYTSGVSIEKQPHK